MNLFDLPEFKEDQPVHNDLWRPEAPPDLSRFKEIALNYETTGLRWWENDRPLAVGIWAGDRGWYLPFGHRGGGNLDEAMVKEWARREIRGKHIVNINTRFDVHMSRVWGVDLEQQGNTVSDVAHYAALLDDHRLRSNLDALIREILNEMPMQRLDESRMASYSAGSAAPRGVYQVQKVTELKNKMWPELNRLDLQRVRALEDRVIYLVCEMEKNGAIIDQELLAEWIIQTGQRYSQGIMELYKLTGMKINPGSNPDVARLYRHLKIEITEFTEKGGPSFTDEVLKHESHPIIKVLRKTKKFKSLHSKLKSYQESIDSHGILRYALHQLRASKSEGDDSGETGTVVGRFTSTEIVDGFGINIQQVLKPEKQFASFGDEFFIRNLFLPAKGKRYQSCDAEQIQYRLAANKAQNPKVLQKYREDPWASYHKMIWPMLKAYKPDITYKNTKDVNFAKQFGAGLTKMALMMEFITKKQFLELRAMKAGKYHPDLKKIAEIIQIYKREMPEVDALLKEASTMAETQGFVTSILGRRMTFNGSRLYKAFNGIIIMSEADIVKTKLVELHDARGETGFLMRAQVHDEVDGDIPDEESAALVAEILNRQSFPELDIPILWGSKTGTSWGDCSRDEIAGMRRERDRSNT